MVQNLDFAQTFLEAAGIKPPSDMQGESLIPIFNGKGQNFRDAAYYHYYEYPSVHMVKIAAGFTYFSNKKHAAQTTCDNLIAHAKGTPIGANPT